MKKSGKGIWRVWGSKLEDFKVGLSRQETGYNINSFGLVSPTR